MFESQTAANAQKTFSVSPWLPDLRLHAAGLPSPADIPVSEERDDDCYRIWLSSTLS